MREVPDKIKQLLSGLKEKEVTHIICEIDIAGGNICGECAGKIYGKKIS